MKHGLVISGGHVVDGSGAPAVRSDVAVQGDRIVAAGHEIRSRLSGLPEQVQRKVLGENIMRFYGLDP